MLAMPTRQASRQSNGTIRYKDAGVDHAAPARKRRRMPFFGEAVLVFPSSFCPGHATHCRLLSPGRQGERMSLGWLRQQPSSADGHAANPRSRAVMAIGCGQPLTQPAGFAATCVRPGVSVNAQGKCQGANPPVGAEPAGELMPIPTRGAITRDGSDPSLPLTDLCAQIRYFCNTIASPLPPYRTKTSTRPL